MVIFQKLDQSNQMIKELKKLKKLVPNISLDINTIEINDYLLVFIFII